MGAGTRKKKRDGTIFVPPLSVNFFNRDGMSTHDGMIFAPPSEARNRVPANIYLFKVNNRNTRKKCEICSKLTIKKPD